MWKHFTYNEEVAKFALETVIVVTGILAVFGGLALIIKIAGG